MSPSPTLKPPAGSCDCHMHVYDDRYPVNPAWPVPPPRAPAADYLRARRELGLERAVVVQPNAYAFDNRCTTDAIRDLGPQARGVATVKPDIPDTELKSLDEAGIRGARCHMLPNAYLSWDEMRALAARVAPLGWHVGAAGRARPAHIRRAAPEFPAIRHRPQRQVPGAGAADDPAFLALLRLLDTGSLLGEAVRAVRDVEEGRPAL